MPTKTAQHLSCYGFHCCLQHGLVHSISCWLTRGGGEGRGREGGGEEGKGRGGGEEQKGSNETAETSSLLTSPPPKRTVTKYWKAVTKFSHIGLVSVLNQKTILCVSFPVPLSLIKTVGLASQNLQRTKHENEKLSNNTGRIQCPEPWLDTCKSCSNNEKSIRKD